MNKIKKKIIRVKLRLFRIFQRLFLGKLIGHNASNIIRSIEESSYKPSIKNILVESKELIPPMILSYNFPSKYPLFFRRNKSFEKRNVYRLQNVYSSSDSGVIWTKDNLILQESVGSVNRIINWGGLLCDIALKPKYILNDCLYTVFPTGGGYYHWLIESVPNLLYTINTFTDVKVIVKKYAPVYMIDTLKILFPNDFNKRVVFLDGNLHANSLCFTQFHAYSGFVCNEDIDIITNTLKDKFLNTISDRKQCNKRIYISRSKSSKRRLANELELEEILKKFDFNIIFAEELSLSEQVILFSNANFLIAPHGAGLANLIWAHSSFKVMEIFPANIFNDCYARLAVQMGFEYRYLVCSNDDSSYGKIDIDLVVKMIKELDKEFK